MMKKTKMKSLVSTLCAGALMVSALGLGMPKSIQAMDAAEAAAQNVVISEKAEQEVDASMKATLQTADFSVELFRQNLSGQGNTLISPFSVFFALGMTANGAEGETLHQMEETLGLSLEECNAAAQMYLDARWENDENPLKLANSIWINNRNDFRVNPNFLKDNADIYQAEVFETVFNQQTAQKINGWIDTKTEGKIPEIIDQVPNNAIMYLANALSFESEWMEPYEKFEVEEGIFHRADGASQNVEFMNSEESYYVEDEQAAGFIKPYADHRYAFMAVLPNEGVSLEEYIEELDGEKLQQMIREPESVLVHASMPKFESDYSVELNQALQNMGMKDAFSPVLADFSGMGGGLQKAPLCISDILHKTFIAVDEQGTKAGAATVVQMAKTSLLNPEDAKTVNLDRPFIYMIVDTQNQIPLFMGTVNEI